MTRYSVKSRDQIFVKGYGFFVFAKYTGDNITKNIDSKQSQNIVDNAKQSATDALTTASKRSIQKTTKATGDLIGDKIADKTTKVSRTSL